MSRGKLLLADDSVTIQKVVNLTFADEGIEVVTAANGDLAMEMIVSERPDVVLADVNMPGMSGYQICETLRGSEDTKHIPVLLLVGSFEPFDEVEANRVGASGYLTKPFQSIRLLVSQVSELLETTGEGRDEQQAPARVEEGQSVSKTEEPQTTDIDDLYNQSFAETVEIRAGDEVGIEFSDSGMDDEIIETEYLDNAEDGASEDAIEPASTVSPFEERASNESFGVEPASFIPQEQPYGASAESNFDQTQRMPDYDPRSVDPQLAALENHQNVVSFDSRAPLLDHSPEPAGFSSGDSDLLELPGTGSSHPFDSVALPTREEESRDHHQITELSPELIDLIVQKVIDKMAENPRQT